MYSEVAWVLVSSGTKVQLQIILDPDFLPDYLTVDLLKRQLIPDLHPRLHGQSIIMWDNLIMQPSNHIHLSMHIIHFIIHLHAIVSETLQHPWQWPLRQNSESSNHNWVRYYPPHTTFMRVSGHQWIILWRFTFAGPHKQNLPTSQDFYWSTADKRLHRWCTNRSSPLYYYYLLLLSLFQVGTN